MLVLEIGRVRPRKRKRWNSVWRDHPDLYRKVVAAGWFSEYDLDEQLDYLQMSRELEDPDWDSLDADERQKILAHDRLYSDGDSSLQE